MKKVFAVAICLLSLFLTVSWAHALSFTFSDDDFLGGASWGVMDITPVDVDTLQVIYTAAPGSTNPTGNEIPLGSQVTGFGFAFTPSTALPGAVLNPSDDPGAGSFPNDREDLDWIVLDNLNAIPNPANGDEFTPVIDKTDFLFGVTEGNANNLSPPGIEPNEMDIFYLVFNNLGLDLTGIDLNNFVALTGIRLQGLPDDINTGSLFLVGDTPSTPAPEPATALLLVIGLSGFICYARTRTKRQ